MILYVRPAIPEGYPERLLLASILRRACYDIALYKSSRRLKDRRLYIAAYQWMFTHNDPRKMHPDDRFTSFINICTILDQDPDEIRKKTLKLTRKDVKKIETVDPHGRLH